MASASFQPTALRSRRTVMAAAGAAGLAVALTACGSSDDSSAAAGSQDAGGSRGNGEGNAQAGTELAKTADIPEGGGKVFASEGVVVTQPTAGEFKAFSATCTHQGCAVKSVANGVINCPCHQSNFSITDGSVQSGPASVALPAQRISVEGDSIKLA
ncbi:iron-sulfur protein [Streptomyces ruber]|uniref:Cytochrome bc1 complex Rieske iron-sulfur subunit n=2 Tax=Streptomyces TaxID=1883 RepID=A0A918BM77_9ACTN|nr:Rieske (2Fe-2S) protein [Streptomyces ruber]GGQ79241.1 iron-sulfur protein [Streptomyces ruber]